MLGAWLPDPLAPQVEDLDAGAPTEATTDVHPRADVVGADGCALGALGAAVISLLELALLVLTDPESNGFGILVSTLRMI